MTTATRYTKSQLLRQIAALEARLSAVQNTLAPFTGRFGDFAPCGKMQDVYGHPFEDAIRNAVSDQWDGTLHRECRDNGDGCRDGWMIVDLDDTPYGVICAHVRYTTHDGTFVDRFCQIARMESST